MACGRPARRRARGGRCGGWWLRVAAVANCGAADRLVGSVSPRAAAPGSLAGVLCPESLQPPQATDGGGTATGGRRARPGDGLPPPAPTQTSGGLLTVIECAYTCITRRRPPQVPLQLDTTITAYPATSMRRMQSPHASADGGTGRLWAGTRACKMGALRAGAGRGPRLAS